MGMWCSSAICSGPVATSPTSTTATPPPTASTTAFRSAGSATGRRPGGCCSTSCPSAAVWPTSSGIGRERKFVNYHNITPADLLEAWVPAVGEEVRWGRAQLRDLAPVTEFAIADSAFNERELQAAGYRSTKTVPLLIDLDGFAGSPDPALAARLADQKATRGRGPAVRREGLAPQGPARPDQGARRLPPPLRPGGPTAPGGRSHQRRVPDGRRAVRRRAGPPRRGRDRRVGDPRGADRLLRRPPTPSSASPTTKGSAFRSSRPCTTGCPIVAYTNTAVPETVEGAGLILPNKEPVRVAAAIDRVVGDPELRSMLAGAAAERVGLLRPPPGAGRVRLRPRGSLRRVRAAAAAGGAGAR